MINRLPPWTSTQKDPFKILYSRKPNVSYFRVFGPKTNKFTISRDVVFDEVSSLFSAQKILVLGDYQNNLELLFPEVNWPTPSNEDVEIVSPSQNIYREGDGEHQATRRSTREKRHPDYLKDYEVKLQNIL